AEERRAWVGMRAELFVYKRIEVGVNDYNNPQTVSMTRSSKPSLMLRNIVATLWKIFMAPMECSIRTRLLLILRFSSFCSGLNSLPRGFLVGCSVEAPSGA